MNDGLLCTADAFVRATNQLGAGLHEHLNGDVIGDEVFLDELAHEVEVGLGRRGEADLDLLEAHGDEDGENGADANGDDDNGDNSGSAYVFERSGDVWTQKNKLLADDGASGDYFGGSVAISGDTLVVGSPQDNDGGSVYVFKRSGSIWTQEQKISPTKALLEEGLRN